MELVDILVLGTSAERRAGSNPAEGSFFGELIITTCCTRLYTLSCTHFVGKKVDSV